MRQCCDGSAHAHWLPRQLETASCCALQVLDDSTCKATRALVDDKVLEWKERGVNCECIRRTNRQGYKAGALKEVRRLSCGAGFSSRASCVPSRPFSGESEGIAECAAWGTAWAHQCWWIRVPLLCVRPLSACNKPAPEHASTPGSRIWRVVSCKLSEACYRECAGLVARLSKLLVCLWTSVVKWIACSV